MAKEYSRPTKHLYKWNISATLLGVVLALTGCDQGPPQRVDGYEVRDGSGPIMLGGRALSGKLAYVRSRKPPEEHQVVIIDLETSDKTVIPSERLINGPEFLDGANKMLAFTTTGPSRQLTRTAVTIDTESGQISEMAELPRETSFPKPSPNSDRVAFYSMSSNQKSAQIKVITRKDNSIEEIDCHPHQRCMHPRWHPTKNALIYVADWTKVIKWQGDSGKQKTVFRPAKENQRVEEAIFSPDGQKILILITEGPLLRITKSILAVLDKKEAKEQIVYQSSHWITTAAWAGDSKTIAFSKTNRQQNEQIIYLYDYISGDKTPVSDSGWHSGDASWHR